MELHEKILQYARDNSHLNIDCNKIKKQIKNELLSIQNARDDINKTIETMNKIGYKDNDNFKLENILLSFIKNVNNNLEKQFDVIGNNKNNNNNYKNNNNLSSKILAIMDSERSAEIGIRCLIDNLNKNKMQINYNIICNLIGKEIERNLFLQNKLSSSEIIKFIGNEYDKNKLNEKKLNKKLANNLKIKIGDSFNLRNIYQIGGLIIDSIIDSCHNDQGENIFIHQYQYQDGKQFGIISIKCDKFKNILLSSLRYKPSTEISPIAQPMIIPPRPWKNIDDGPFFYYNEKLMRFIDYKYQYKPLRNNKNIKNLLKCINILQSTSWQINEKVLNVMEHLYQNENGDIAGLPNKNDYKLPNKHDFKCDKEYLYKLNYIKKINAEQHSLRCDLNLKLNLAKELIKENEIYFPLNIDFRGRIYPISPHINHIGSDVVRGLMLFSKKKKLGQRGWFWLNVNLANKFGNDKIKNIERFNWSINHKDDILNVYNDPLKNRWWLSADSPFQALSICIEIGAAYNNNNNCVYDYECNLPVGQDGSCNGLQHYAAMLLDEKMAKHVNVANNEIYNLKRGDVYSEVQKCVINMIKKDYENRHNKNYKYAEIIHNDLTRKIVKQTVMTSVYGVTSYGAKQQIKKWLINAIENNQIKNNKIDIYSKEGIEIINKLSIYLSKYTMYAIGLTNTPAYLSMLWLKNCAYLIAKNGYRVSWITPILNLPCTQHYMSSNRPQKINTEKQSIIIKKNPKKINILKQSSAFPPNFVHSLDSTHCLLTANECYTKHGLSFASIHDSFWTHPSDIDIMSKVLRENFIKLHKYSLLKDLFKSFSILYPEIKFPPPPNQSTFDIEQVKNSEFFFS